MGEPLILEVEGKPQAWARARVRRSGGFFTSKACGDHKKAIQAEWACSVSYSEDADDRPMRMELMFRLPRGKRNKRAHHDARPDLDNLVKTVLDALNGLAYKDDAQVIEIMASKRYATHEADVGTTIRIEPV